MTVSELITKLREMPQDLPVYRLDASWGTVSINEVLAQEVTEDDYDPATRYTPITYIKIEAVLLG